MNNLGMLYLNGRGAQRDINVARMWFEKAIALNNAQARENLKRLEEAPPFDGAQVASRRLSCLQTCTTLQRSYVNSVCDRYSALAEDGKPKRTTCIDVSLSVVMQCRNSCREWAPTSLADNKCVTCFQSLISCMPDKEDHERPYSEHSEGCLDAFNDCTANCRSGMPNATNE